MRAWYGHMDYALACTDHTDYATVIKGDHEYWRIVVTGKQSSNCNDDNLYHLWFWTLIINDMNSYPDNSPYSTDSRIIFINELSVGCIVNGHDNVYEYENLATEIVNPITYISSYSEFIIYSFRPVSIQIMLYHLSPF